MNYLEEEQLNYTLTLSLKSIALTKITTTLWNQDDMRDLVAEMTIPNLDKWKTLKELEDKVIEKVRRLPLPERFKKQILVFVDVIGEQILTWIICHRSLLSAKYVKKNFNKLCWTSQGTLDRKKSAKQLMKDENLEIETRYNLACIYCLEDNIRDLWGPLPESSKAAFYNDGHPSFREKHELVVFWTYYIKGELQKLNRLIRYENIPYQSPYQFAFEYAAYNGNIVATMYFLPKLTENEREESLVEYAALAAKKRVFLYDNNSELADVVCFLLSQLNPKEQIKVFKKYPYEVLHCFLDRPWQEFFMDTANRMWPYLSIYKFNDFLGKIIDKVKYGYNDCDYQVLFKEIWVRSSQHKKKYVLHKCSTGGLLLSKLFHVKDEKNVLLILKDATPKQKEKIIFCSDNMDLCESLAYNNQWDLLKSFINECVSSKEKAIKLREEFKKRMEAEPEKTEEDLKFLHLLDDLIQKDDKKRGVEDDDDSAKRMCSIIV